MPTVVILGGPNGAGKTTSARALLADTLGLMTYVNADVIAQGLAGFSPESAAIEASRIMLERLRHLADRGEDFAFETTLAGRSYAASLRTWREAGYHIHLIYFWLESPELAIQRVADRVGVGGHHIPEITVRQRYHRSVANLTHLYMPLVQSWEVYDNSGESYRIVAESNGSGPPIIWEAETWKRMQR